MAKRELKTSDLKESAAGVSGFSEPEQRNGAAGVSVIHSSSPRGGLDENTGKRACLLSQHGHRLPPRHLPGQQPWAASTTTSRTVRSGFPRFKSKRIRTSVLEPPRDTHRSRQQQDGRGLTGSRQMLHDGNSEALQFGLI